MPLWLKYFEAAIDLIRNLKGVKAAFLLTEWKPGILKISFRSSSEVNVNQIASKLDGGGHKKAAGASIKDDIESGVKRVIDCFKESFHN